MFRFFENLVDPYAPYAQTDTPPRRLWPFLADYIWPFRKVVLKDGRIAEEGSHSDLLKRGGRYARFWARQSGGFIGLEEAAE